MLAKIPGKHKTYWPNHAQKLKLKLNLHKISQKDLKKKLEFDFGYQFKNKTDHEEFLRQSARDR